MGRECCHLSFSSAVGKAVARNRFSRRALSTFIAGVGPQRADIHLGYPAIKRQKNRALIPKPMRATKARTLHTGTARAIGAPA